MQNPKVFPNCFNPEPFKHFFIGSGYFAVNGNLPLESILL